MIEMAAMVEDRGRDRGDAGLRLLPVFQRGRITAELSEAALPERALSPAMNTGFAGAS